VIAALSLLAGVLLGVAAAHLPSDSWLIFATVSAAFAGLSSWRSLRAVRCLACLLAGMVLASVEAGHWQALRVDPATAGSRLLLEGRIQGLPERHGNDLRFDAQVQILAPARGDEHWRRARLTWREAPVEPRAGESWRWLVQVEAAGRTRNFEGLDVERLLFRDRVHLTGRIVPVALNEKRQAAPPSIDRLRERIARRISQSVADPDAAALMIALAVGHTAGVSRDQWRVFNATGTTHLVAISGLHVTLFAWLALRAARMAWRLLPRAAPFERETFCWLLAMGAAGGYALLAGSSVPTQRTWIMLAVFVLARLAVRHVSAARLWSLAMIAVLLIDVLAPLSAGFWLSFVAVGVILLLTSEVPVAQSRWRRMLTLQLAIMLALAPLTAAIFGGISLVGFVVNLLAIPIVSFGFVPLVLLGALCAGVFPLIADPVFQLAAASYQVLWPGLVAAADMPFAQWRVEPPAWWYAYAAAAAWFSLHAWPMGLRLAATAAVLPLVFADSRTPPSGTFQVNVLDTGRGSAVLVTTRSHVLLFDTGDSWGTNGARIVQQVLPALDALGVERIDLLVLPGLDPERARGAALLASERGVDRILVGGGWPGSTLPAERCVDMQFMQDDVEFATFVAGELGQFCMLRVAAGAHRLLVAGEVDTPAEQALSRRVSPGTLASHVVVMGRHGSEQASCKEWIETTAARIAVAAGGIADSQSRARTLARWRAAGVRVLDTHADGGIEIAFGTQGVAALATARTARYPFAWRRRE
jgi:competence protein ComEC